MPTDFLSVLREFHDRNPTLDLVVNHPMDFQAVSRTATDLPPVSFGAWSDAEELRKWSFLRRTPQQRLDWLIDALSIRSLVRAADGTPAGDVQTGQTEES